MMRRWGAGWLRPGRGGLCAVSTTKGVEAVLRTEVTEREVRERRNRAVAI